MPGLRLSVGIEWFTKVGGVSDAPEKAYPDNSCASMVWESGKRCALRA